MGVDGWIRWYVAEIRRGSMRVYVSAMDGLLWATLLCYLCLYGVKETESIRAGFGDLIEGSGAPTRRPLQREREI